MKEPKIVGIMPGGFNLLHAGHLEAFKFAKKHCDELIVVLVVDQSSKGHKLYKESVEDRFLKLRATKYIDDVIPVENEANLLELLSLLEYDVYFLSEEYRYTFDEGKKVIGTDKIIYTPRKHNWSTTNEVKKIRNV